METFYIFILLLVIHTLAWRVLSGRVFPIGMFQSSMLFTERISKFSLYKCRYREEQQNSLKPGTLHLTSCHPLRA
jgi:hypothetical protein